MLRLLTSTVLAGLALADFTPTAPGPGDSFAAGSDCTIAWKPDESGQWTNVSIHLMSGSNDNMTEVTTVASGLDGTDPSFSPYNWTCPDVNPHSAIYFYQFTNGNDRQDSTWTTRFTITSPDGNYEPPAHDTQPDGDAVPWGEGSLVADHQFSAQAIDTGNPSSDRDAFSSVHHHLDGSHTNDVPSSSTPTPHYGDYVTSSVGQSSNTAGSSLY
ncbi:Ser-Thr-rich glycosyl-phosphatidyl-inositol-anchored membrane family-domain-containing protein [Trametes punicea]|nr:Ser-Thr-rich glycosyl-phosphatidyl-inositol-anchored membrane family-domain-containing protein [Trametes punicea]